MTADQKQWTARQLQRLESALVDAECVTRDPRAGANAIINAQSTIVAIKKQMEELRRRAG